MGRTFNLWVRKISNGFEGQEHTQGGSLHRLCARTACLGRSLSSWFHCADNLRDGLNQSCRIVL